MQAALPAGMNTSEHSRSALRRRPRSRHRLDSLLERFANPLRIALPTALRPRPPTAEREWSQGVEAERIRALALLDEVRAAGFAPSAGPIATVTALHLAIRACLDAAERWHSYYREAGDSPGRFALLARAEVASLVACELRELADDSLEDVAA
jgi:hypothetical protein